MHSSVLGSAQSWMCHPDGGAASAQIPHRAWGDLCQVEEAVDIVTPLPQHVGRGCRVRRVVEQLPGRHQRPIWCGLR
jgi:hypothetical protein